MKRNKKTPFPLAVILDGEIQEDVLKAINKNDIVIIRKNINPEASSVPLTYILDENGKLIDSHDSTITIEELNDLIDRNM